MRANADAKSEFGLPHADTARALNVSEPTIGRAVRELKVAGLLAVAHETARATVFRVGNPPRFDLDQSRIPFDSPTDSRTDAQRPIIHVMSNMIEHSKTSVQSSVIVQRRLIDHPRSNTQDIGTRARRPARLQNLPLSSQSASSDIPPPPVFRGSEEGGGGGGEAPSGGGERDAKAAGMLAAIRDPKTRDEMAERSDAELSAAVALAGTVKRAGDPIALAVRFVRDGSAAAEAARAGVVKAKADESKQRAAAIKADKAREAVALAEREVEETRRRIERIAAAPTGVLVDALAWALDRYPMLSRPTRALIGEAIAPGRDARRAAVDSACGVPAVRAIVDEFLTLREAGAVTVPTLEGSET